MIATEKSSIIAENPPVNAMSIPDGSTGVTASASSTTATTIENDNMNIANILNSTGPIVNAVLLKAGNGNGNNIVEDIQVDTTPKKQMVSKILGGPFTFLGQYEDEGIVLMIRKDGQQQQSDDDDEKDDENPQEPNNEKDDDDSSKKKNSLPINHHKLQPPFRDTIVRGDILALKVAAVEEDEDDEMNTIANATTMALPKSNDEFFLNYTKDEYLKFAARTDVEFKPMEEDDDDEEIVEEDDDESSQEGDEMEDDDDEDDDDDEEDGEGGGFMELLMGQILQRFQQENGRMPDEQELKALESAMAEKLGGLGGGT